METPAINMVEIVDLSPSDALLPILECVSNSIISLDQSALPLKQRTIDVKIVRGAAKAQGDLYGEIRPIKDVVVTDNGLGFTEFNYESFKTPHSNKLRHKGCLGVGRFTILAAFKTMKVNSNYRLNGGWKHREFEFDAFKEIQNVKDEVSSEQASKTIVELKDFYNEDLADKTAVSIDAIGKAIMEHFIIFYLSGTLPKITIHENDERPQNVNELYREVSKDNEARFNVFDHEFRVYITRNPRITSRKYHYVHYCADSMKVGRGKRLGDLDSIFFYPLSHNFNEAFLNVYVASEYLNRKKTPVRNAFHIPQTKTQAEVGEISFEDIERELVRVLRKEYSDHIKEAQERDLADWKRYIATNPQYNSLLKDEDTLRGLPANSTDEKKEEELHRIVFTRRKKAEKTINEFIDTDKQLTEQTLQELTKDIQDKTKLDSDSLADYMVRRKAVIDLFERFLQFDRDGTYKLEADIHSLIFPMGFTSEDIDYDAHNLWLLDERLVSYKYIASDKAIGSYSDVRSQKAADIAMFDNPIGFGDRSHGDVTSMIVFEFKRPGDVASNMPKNCHWEFSALTDKYFDDFTYGRRKNSQGMTVNVRDETRKFAYIVLSEIPEELEKYNTRRDWKRTPFGTFYKMVSGSNLHMEAMTFDTLINAARERHNPFFDRLFTGRSMR